MRKIQANASSAAPSTNRPFAINLDYEITVTYNGESALGVKSLPVNEIVLPKASHRAYLPEPTNRSSHGTYVINDIIGAFDSIDTEEILDGWDIQVQIAPEEIEDDYGTYIVVDDYEKQHFYLVGYDGEAFLANDHFGQLLIPLGKSASAEIFHTSLPMDKAWASFIANRKRPLKFRDTGVTHVSITADELRDRYHATGTPSSFYNNLYYEGTVGTMEFSPDLLPAIARGNKYLMDDNGMFKVAMKRSFSWYPDALRTL